MQEDGRMQGRRRKVQKVKSCNSNVMSYSCDKGCVCCIEDRDCAQPLECRKNNGVCMKTCSGDERELKDLCYTYNTGPTCRCCAPKCSQDSACTLWGGVCVDGPEQCPTEFGTHMVSEGCTGYNCVCCKPVSGRDCAEAVECSIKNGICKKTCSGNERELKDLCQTDNTGSICRCCAPKCSQDSACTLWGGICVDGPEQCPTEYGTHIVTEGCTGYKCVCCKPVTTTQKPMTTDSPGGPSDSTSRDPGPSGSTSGGPGPGGSTSGGPGPGGSTSGGPGPGGSTSGGPGPGGSTSGGPGPGGSTSGGPGPGGSTSGGPGPGGSTSGGPGPGDSTSGGPGPGDSTSGGPGPGDSTSGGPGPGDSTSGGPGPGDSTSGGPGPGDSTSGGPGPGDSTSGGPGPGDSTSGGPGDSTSGDPEDSTSGNPEDSTSGSPDDSSSNDTDDSSMASDSSDSTDSMTKG
ncbi:mucin-19-like [Portunus trituberculatus]|uniref:mucin-19-like n=2 Tax=Portunus trituberculatus TaxID=210409 RepID=UPI001E1D0492|nr:mucin-19-like [Portunus trituberculatus]